MKLYALIVLVEVAVLAFILGHHFGEVRGLRRGWRLADSWRKLALSWRSMCLARDGQREPRE